MSSPVVYKVEFEDSDQALAAIKRCFDAIEKTGFCTFETFGYKDCTDPDKWGWRHLYNIRLYDYVKVAIQDRPEYINASESIDKLHVSAEILKILIEQNRIYTIDQLTFYHRNNALSALHGIGNVRAEELEKAMEEFLRQ